MSRNGSGTYTLPAGNPVVTGTTIASTWANNTLSDIASALTDSVAADGQTAMTGNLNLSSNKIVNLATPTLSTDAVTKAYADALVGGAGSFTTLTSSGATTFTAGTASTSTTTGTAVITGGLGVSGRINAANFDGIVGANTAAAGSFTTLSATGVTTVQAGTAALPAITTTGDTNTGIFFSAADTIDFAEGGTACGQFDSSANFKFNSGYGSVATAYGCRAWVNFDGTGTPAIRASGNVSSITDNGTGDYTVNFTTALVDANYAYVGTGRRNDGTQRPINFSQSTNAIYNSSTTALRFVTWVEAAAALEDALTFNVAIFR
jgi:hypothetical protein